MIVNTKVFNYRLTLGTLIVAILALAVYGFSNYSALKSNSDFLEHEKKLLKQELSTFIDRYEELSSENDSLKSQIENTRQRAQLVFDSLEILKSDLSTLSRIKAELMFLKRQDRVRRSDSLEMAIDNLKEKNEITNSALAEQLRLNSELQAANRELSEVLIKNAVLRVNSLEVKILEKRRSGDYVETSLAKDTDVFELCFTLAENPLVDSGEKTIYVQILSPDNNVLNDQGVVKFGDKSLIYSERIPINYQQMAQQICTRIREKESFDKGRYYISVFEGENRLGTTQIELN